jgi:hypothetical protein
MQAVFAAHNAGCFLIFPLDDNYDAATANRDHGPRAGMSRVGGDTAEPARPALADRPAAISARPDSIAAGVVTIRRRTVPTMPATAAAALAATVMAQRWRWRVAAISAVFAGEAESIYACAAATLESF